MKTFSCFESPIVIEGLATDIRGKMHRLPDILSDKINSEAFRLSKYPAGACIRFRTDAKKIKITAKIKMHPYYSNNSGLNVCGISIFVDGNYIGAAGPFEATGHSYWREIEKKPEMQDIRLELPLFTELDWVEFETEDDALIEAPSEHKIKNPVLFYGSSITHGACSSHPGMSYPSILARKFDFPLINLGFSGSALADPALAEYIASLELTAFVFDYDFNASDAEYLRRTHGAFFNTIREKQPELPILIMSRPSCIDDPETPARRDAVYQTYKNACDNGDKHVAFIDGASFFEGFDRGLCTIDLTHPTDLGFYLMAKGVEPVLKKLISEK